MLTLAILATLLVANFLLTAMFLLVGSRWVRASRPTYFRALLCVTGIWLTGAAGAILSEILPDLLNKGDHQLELLIAILVFAGQIAVACLIIQHVIGTTARRAFKAWLVSLIPSLFILGFLFLVVIPFVAEALIVPTNAMAPTIIGWHREGTCPLCGGVLIVPASAPTDVDQIPADEFEPMGICKTCQKASRAKSVKPDVCIPDRVMTNKLVAARRWDIVVYHLPRDPNLKYLRRVVGLPGEEVFLEDGAVWVNGTKLTPPSDLSDVQFNGKTSIPMEVPFGSRDKPWKLKQDEYCVLGDFAMGSYDSRLWGALPGANILGVVSVRYWPLSRWRIWR